ncbi:MAG: ATP-binding cassette domain-containing protein [Tumebacillaceae bacterium]
MAIQVNGLQFNTGFTGILGPQGVGKTRLLRKLATIDMEVQQTNQGETGKVCYVSRELEAFEAYTVEEYLNIVADCENAERLEVCAQLVDATIERLHLTHYANVRISNLPKVVKTQTVIAKALLNDPEAMLLDDVLDGLSEQERMHIGYILSEIGKERVILLAGTFSESVEGLFDTVCLLHPDKEAVLVPVNTAYSWVEGKVWEYVAPELPSQVDRLVCAVKQSDDAVYVREIAQGEPCEEVSQVTPTLGDAYLWWSHQQNEIQL